MVGIVNLLFFLLLDKNKSLYKFIVLQSIANIDRAVHSKMPEREALAARW